MQCCTLKCQFFIHCYNALPGERNKKNTNSYCFQIFLMDLGNLGNKTVHCSAEYKRWSYVVHHANLHTDIIIVHVTLREIYMYLYTY